jgi:hypothetical protein
VLTYIPLSQGASDSVHYGMDQDIRVGMTFQAQTEGDLDPTKDQGPVFNKTVCIISKADPKQGKFLF